VLVVVRLLIDFVMIIDLAGVTVAFSAPLADVSTISLIIILLFLNLNLKRSFRKIRELYEFSQKNDI
jgi:hypothetical protein